MMRIIPVIDLLDGEVVHGKSGEREKYEPIKSQIADSAEPLKVARSFQSLGLDELYVADLNAISLGGDNLEIIDQLSSDMNMNIMVDGGFRKAREVRPYVERGVSRLVLATETLGSFKTVKEVIDSYKLPVTASVDLKGERVIASSLELNLSFPEVVQRFSEFGASEIVILSLGKVGTATGPPEEPLKKARDLISTPLLIGGGVRDMGDIYRLKRLGASGILLATALHNGSIGKADVDQL